LDSEFPKLFGLWLDLDCVKKIQDWIWIAKLNSALISGQHNQGKAIRQSAQTTFQEIAQTPKTCQSRMGLNNVQETKAGHEIASSKQ